MVIPQGRAPLTAGPELLETRHMLSPARSRPGAFANFARLRVPIGVETPAVLTAVMPPAASTLMAAVVAGSTWRRPTLPVPATVPRTYWPFVVTRKPWLSNEKLPARV